MKYMFLIIMVIFFSCVEKKVTVNSTDELVKKRIIQKIEVAGMGFVKNLNFESLAKVNDTTYTGIHSFTNSFIKKDVRVSRNYIFTSDLDSIIKAIDLKTEMKSQGEWVDAKL